MQSPCVIHVKINKGGFQGLDLISLAMIVDKNNLLTMCTALIDQKDYVLQTAFITYTRNFLDQLHRPSITERSLSTGLTLSEQTLLVFIHNLFHWESGL